MPPNNESKVSSTPTVDCPSCKAQVICNEQYPERPFCSKRCKDSDFIDWANEAKVIAGSPVYEDIFTTDIDEGY